MPTFSLQQGSRHRAGVGRLLRASLCVAVVLLLSCGEEAPPRGEVAEQTAAQNGRKTADLFAFGRDQEMPFEVASGIYQAHGVGNTNVVVTDSGTVVIDTGLPTSAGGHRSLLDEVVEGPVAYVVLTHAHLDHAGGAGSWIEDGTRVVTHAEFSESQRYLTELLPFFSPRNHVFYPDSVPEIPGWAASVLRVLYPNVTPTDLVHDRLRFELGGVRFEVIATPGAEGTDSLCVWLPDRKILFTGDFFGPIFPMVPNLYTIRGEKLRFAIPYVESLERIMALEPEVLVPSHFTPIRGKQRIARELRRTRDSVRWVHDAVVQGMNDGKDVYTLMREIRPPPALQLPESHGKVAWNVRAIWEGYAGWFDFETPTQLYAVPPSSVYADLVELSGGARALAERASARAAAGEPEQALYLVEIALSSEPLLRAALEVREKALLLLLERSGGVNHSEVYWLRDQIAKTRARLGG